MSERRSSGTGPLGRALSNARSALSIRTALAALGVGVVGAAVAVIAIGPDPLHAVGGFLGGLDLGWLAHSAGSAGRSQGAAGAAAGSGGAGASAGGGEGGDGGFEPDDDVPSPGEAAGSSMFWTIVNYILPAGDGFAAASASENAAKGVHALEESGAKYGGAGNQDVWGELEQEFERQTGNEPDFDPIGDDDFEAPGED